jgi:hypothetical protein
MSQKKRFLLRLDSKLYEILEKWSADELRSVNAQIEYLLKEATRKAGRLKEEKSSPKYQQATEIKDSEDEIEKE